MILRSQNLGTDYPHIRKISAQKKAVVKKSKKFKDKKCHIETK